MPIQLPIRPKPPLTAKTTHSQYKATLRAMTDEQLTAERAKLEALKADASTGAARDPDAVKRADAKLAEIAEEEAARKAIDGSKDPAYREQVHGMSGDQLTVERRAQEERLKESTTGDFRDPVAAADARAKLEALKAESAGRLRDTVQDVFQGPLPTDPATEKDGRIENAVYGMRVAGMSDSELAAEKARLQQTVKDAGSGAHQDPVAAANAQARLEVVQKEEDKRLGTNSGFGAHLRGLSDEELAAEKATRVALVEDASHGRNQDPGTVARAEAEVAAIEREQQHRTRLEGSKDPAYGASIHAMDDEALETERKRQQEALKEASTGTFKDPVAAAAAQEKLMAIGRERGWRTGDVMRGDLPVDEETRKLTPAQLKRYGAKLRGASDEELAATRSRIEQRMTDASSGPHQDPQVVENLKERLKVLDAEVALRAELKEGPQPEYALQTHQLSDADLKKEFAAQSERLEEASSGSFQDPAVAADAREKLELLKAEERRRNPMLEMLRPRTIAA